MELKDIIKFEPVDITHITITIGLVLIIIYVRILAIPIIHSGFIRSSDFPDAIS